MDIEARREEDKKKEPVWLTIPSDVNERFFVPRHNGDAGMFCNALLTSRRYTQHHIDYRA